MTKKEFCASSANLIKVTDLIFSIAALCSSSSSVQVVLASTLLPCDPFLFPFSINFNHDSSLLCVSSDHGTIHIFAVEEQKRTKSGRYNFVI